MAKISKAADLGDDHMSVHENYVVARPFFCYRRRAQFKLVCLLPVQACTRDHTYAACTQVGQAVARRIAADAPREYDAASNSIALLANTDAEVTLSTVTSA